MFNENAKSKIRVLLSGYSGRMGGAVSESAQAGCDFLIAAGVCKGSKNLGLDHDKSVLLFNNFSEIKNILVDVIIDFSSKDILEDILKFALENSVPAVIGTTGHDKNQLRKIKEASENIPIFFSGNMSIGVNLLIKSSREIAKILRRNCDVEIIEKHHNKKKDAPSGTALMVADAISSALDSDCGKSEYIFDRTKSHKERRKGEIGISCVRAGTIVGEHSVIFGLEGETITLTHSADSRKIFARGALAASKFIIKKPPGLYTMEDLCKEGLCCL